ncbi:copper chaperone CopZ [Filimonas zeae]|nr:heavy-metal-associated domain-containing protein [Filimonas zeae]MDR6342547.1 copper chaperone CopZ [Filimonas zeae]
MKKLIAIIGVFVLAVSVSGTAQEIKSVSVKASGLTCSMCSKAIFKALEKVPFVKSVDADIENSGYDLTFKPGEAVSLDALKDAVTDAGFSVAAMQVKADFTAAAVQNDAHIKGANYTFHFIQVKDTTLQGEQQLLILDKDFLPEKERKKYAAQTAMACFETGKMKNQAGGQDRIYHVTMN